MKASAAALEKDDDMNNQLILRACLKDYPKYLTNKKLPPALQETHAAFAGSLVRFCNENGVVSVEEDSLQTLIALFLKTLHKEAGAADSIAFCDSSLRIFQQYVSSQLALTSVRRSANRALSDSDISRLVQAISIMGDARDRCVIELVLYHRLKPLEVSALNLDDLAITQNSPVELTIRSRARSTKVRLTQSTSNALVLWLRIRRSYDPSFNSEALFLNKHGARLSTMAVDNIVRKIGIKARLNICSRVLHNSQFPLQQQTVATPYSHAQIQLGQQLGAPLDMH